MKVKIVMAILSVLMLVSCDTSSNVTRITENKGNTNTTLQSINTKPQITNQNTSSTTISKPIDNKLLGVNGNFRYIKKIEVKSPIQEKRVKPEIVYEENNKLYVILNYRAPESVIGHTKEIGVIDIESGKYSSLLKFENDVEVMNFCMRGDSIVYSVIEHSKAARLMHGKVVLHEKGKEVVLNNFKLHFAMDAPIFKKVGESIFFRLTNITENEDNNLPYYSTELIKLTDVEKVIYKNSVQMVKSKIRNIDFPDDFYATYFNLQRNDPFVYISMRNSADSKIVLINAKTDEVKIFDVKGNIINYSVVGDKLFYVNYTNFENGIRSLFGLNIRTEEPFEINKDFSKRNILHNSSDNRFIIFPYHQAANDSFCYYDVEKDIYERVSLSKVAPDIEEFAKGFELPKCYLDKNKLYLAYSTKTGWSIYCLDVIRS